MKITTAALAFCALAATSASALAASPIDQTQPVLVIEAAQASDELPAVQHDGLPAVQQAPQPAPVPAFRLDPAKVNVALMRSR